MQPTEPTPKVHTTPRRKDRDGARQEAELHGPEPHGTTLRARLHSLLIAGLAFFVAVMGLVLWLAFSHFRQDALSERQLLARTVAQSLDALVERSFQSLRQLPPHLTHLDSEARDELRAFRFQFLFREAVFLVDEQGEVLVSDPPFAPFLRDPPLSLREQVTPLRGDLEVGGRPFLAIVQPFQRDGRSYGLVAEMSPRGSAISVFLQSLATAPDLHIGVIDRGSRVIAASDHRHLFQTVTPADLLGERIAARRGFVSDSELCSFCEEDGRATPVLTAMVPLRLAPWAVVVQEHRSAAFATLHSALLILLGVVATFLVAGLVFSWMVSRSVVAPLQTLARQADRLRRGDLTGSIRVEGDREVRLLATTLDQARDRLAASLEELTTVNERLEEQVAHRTDELAELLRRSQRQDARRKVLVRRLLHAGEEERRRIARELHDEISQLLTVIQLSLEEVSADVPGEAAEGTTGDRAAITKARQLLTRTQEEVHRIIFDLRPSVLDDLGLSAAVRWYAQNDLQPRGVGVHLDVEEDLDLAPEVEITVFRIYQEIVTNILRHSEAEHVSIELATRDSRLLLTVEDDGVGFDPGHRTAGAGILGMRERAELIGATLTVDSEPGAGTQVELGIPLAAPQRRRTAPGRRRG